MNKIKIATWNVNSLRVRLPHVLAWLDKEKPDVLALQETKIPNEDFPFAALQAAGYVALASGQKAYNGVALLINQTLGEHNPINMLVDLPELIDPQRRVLGMIINDIYILNLYIPNGESPTSVKYQYKLGWLAKLDCFLKNLLCQYKKIVILGDFNIAPKEIDVHHPKQWEKRVLFSPPEREAFQAMLQVGFVDCFRHLNPAQEKAYSWWDYRIPNAFKNNLGLRIDHILASQPLMSLCIDCRIDIEPRSWERPSDHAPVIATFLLS